MKKVLIIEDDMDTLELLGVITRQSNYEAVLHSNVLPIEEIEQINPSLIILDHWINDHLGGNLCGKLKSNPKTRDIPIVMLSAIIEIGQIAFDNRADGSLSKPFDIEEIESVLECYLCD